MILGYQVQLDGPPLKHYYRRKKPHRDKMGSKEETMVMQDHKNCIFGKRREERDAEISSRE